MDKVVIFNPRSADAKHRIPNSILQVAGSLGGAIPTVMIDGNMERNPLVVLQEELANCKRPVLGVTVMPGPQLQQAIPFTLQLKAEIPNLLVIWGGYFASNQHRVVLNSGAIDFVINGPADTAFPLLMTALSESEQPALNDIPNLIFLADGKIVQTKKEAIPDMDNIAPFPYAALDQRYPLPEYLAKTFMGRKTLSYHSSFGCPFTCSFCAVVPIYNARWKGLSPERMLEDIEWFRSNYAIDAVEFHDNNFFTSRKRVVDFAEGIKDKGIAWWGEGRIDTIDKYSDDDLELMREAGLRMIFLGAETGNDEVLKQMDKGGTQSGAQIKAFAGRLGRIGIIPEYSFVLGMPGKDDVSVMRQINEDIRFIREIKKINPETEIILYVYSPVPTEGSELFEEITAQGFEFPATLEDWLSPAWERFDLRKNPLTPWLKAAHIQRIKNFETVLNAYYPTQTDFRVRGWKKQLLRVLAFWRYHLGFYAAPYEIKLMHKIWRYRQPEEQGFYSE
ncbi:MAG: radical SAM protein [Bacteroidetes bacterium RIFCSPHIGHO2_02_FULL_44_7]|nr:MAG: radical SAM protein [Bacteroidetes bacterium RIFCSPHIGHO2_02_FULL_44_7]